MVASSDGRKERDDSWLVYHRMRIRFGKTPPPHPGMKGVKADAILDELVEASARAYNTLLAPPEVEASLILSRVRERPLVTCRWLIMAVARNLTGMGTGETGKLLGQHHSTIVYGLQCLVDIADVDTGLKSALSQVCDEALAIAKVHVLPLRHGPIPVHMPVAPHLILPTL